MLARRLMAGFLAGASIVVAALLILVLLMIGAGIFELLYTIAAQTDGNASFWSTLRASVLLSAQAFPYYMWSGRWAMLLLGVLGAVLALSESLAARVPLRGHRQLGLAITMGVIAASVLGYMYSIDDQPSLALGAALVFGAALAIWVTWNRWYTYWAVWLHAFPTRVYGSVAASPARSWLPLLSGGWATATLLVLLLFRVHAGLSQTALSGELAVLENSSTAVTTLVFAQRPRQITFSNTGGYGTVDIRLSVGATPIKQVTGMSLAAQGNNSGSAELDLRDLAPGTYRIEVRLREGLGGVVQYQALVGGGAQRSFAPLLGLAIGSWFTLGMLVVVELLIAANWIDAEPTAPA